METKGVPPRIRRRQVVRLASRLAVSVRAVLPSMPGGAAMTRAINSLKPGSAGDGEQVVFGATAEPPVPDEEPTSVLHPEAAEQLPARCPVRKNGLVARTTVLRALQTDCFAPKPGMVGLAAASLARSPASSAGVTPPAAHSRSNSGWAMKGVNAVDLARKAAGLMGFRVTCRATTRCSTLPARCLPASARVQPAADAGSKRAVQRVGGSSPTAPTITIVNFAARSHARALGQACRRVTAASQPEASGSLGRP